MPLVQVRASVYEGPQPSQVVLHDHHVHRWKRRSKHVALRAILRPLLYRSHALNAPHRRVVGLVDAGQGECVQQFELGHYVRPEHLRQLLRDGDEHRDLAATDLIGDRLDRAAHASSLHVAGCVATGSVVALFQKLSWCAFSRSEGCRASRAAWSTRNIRALQTRNWRVGFVVVVPVCHASGASLGSQSGEKIGARDFGSVPARRPTGRHVGRERAARPSTPTPHGSSLRATD